MGTVAEAVMGPPPAATVSIEQGPPGPPPPAAAVAPPPAPPARKPPVAVAPAIAQPGGIAAGNKKFEIVRGVKRKAWRVGIYGPGGVGKTSLASSLESVGIMPAFIDLDEGSEDIDTPRVPNGDSNNPKPWTWVDLLAALRAPIWQNTGAIVIDSGTKAEELAIAHTIATVKNDRGNSVSSIEEYGFGKGLTHVFETFLPLFAELDQHWREGRWVIFILHECVATVPNPAGEDFIRYEPRLQSPSSGKNSIRHRMKEWCDHLLFIGYDVNADKEGKAKGQGTRTIYGTERPGHWAKSRPAIPDMPFKPGDVTLWEKLLKMTEGVK